MPRLARRPCREAGYYALQRNSWDTTAMVTLNGHSEFINPEIFWKIDVLKKREGYYAFPQHRPVLT
jgi:predicted membrane-bound spermidine synthase